MEGLDIAGHGRSAIRRFDVLRVNQRSIRASFWLRITTATWRGARSFAPRLGADSGMVAGGIASASLST